MSGRAFYVVNEVFYSLQGEGVRAGTPNVFIRFTGCNLECRADNEAGFDCDTEFESGVRMGFPELHDAMNIACAETFGISAHAEDDGGDAVIRLSTKSPGWVILTGGEPALQADQQLIDWLHSLSFKVAIETNGTRALPAGIDWVCVSPKSAEHTLNVRRADEVKYVRHTGQAIPRPSIEADHYLLSPAFESIERPDGGTAYRPAPGALEWCVHLVKENPKWRLSIQQHKTWRVR